MSLSEQEMERFKFLVNSRKGMSATTFGEDNPSSGSVSGKVTGALGLDGATNVFGRMANTLIAKYPDSPLSKIIGQSSAEKEAEALTGKTRSEVLNAGVTAPTGKEMAGAVLQTAAIPAGALVTGGASLPGQIAAGAATGYAFDVGKDMVGGKSTAETLTPGLGTLAGAGSPILAKGISLGAGAANNFAKESTKKAKDVVVNTIDDFGSMVSAPSVSDATRVSLNPKEALKGTGQDMSVSVGGKLKKLSELTPDENTKLQFSTQKTINKFTEQAKQFKNNRNPANDPTEIVGKRVDAALDFADKKRRVVGKKMGEIEIQYGAESLPISDSTLNKFADTLKSIDNPKFGVDTADAPIVQKLVKDFDLLESSGASISDRLDFVRSWDKYLNDSKDGFGNFKNNATVNSRIQGAVKTLKDETVDAIAAKDRIYRKLRTDYSTYKQLDEIGDMLLGKDGAMGVRIKGGATVKRALKSNSDAGARQFLTKLKEITGYDAIKDGDLALTAMENVGDFQGLSLLEVLKDGKTGMISKSLEFVQNKVVGDEAARVNKFIKKGSTP